MSVPHWPKAFSLKSGLHTHSAAVLRTRLGAHAEMFSDLLRTTTKTTTSKVLTNYAGSVRENVVAVITDTRVGAGSSVHVAAAL